MNNKTGAVRYGRRPDFVFVSCFVFCVSCFAQGEPPGTKYGHRAYAQAPAKELVKVGMYRRTGRAVKMRREAAAAFLKMAEAAKADGVGLVPISGFRTVDYQRGLFERACRRNGTPEAAARWVAPPGHSEHHTGLALDVGDEAAPEADVDERFEGTPAFRWLKGRAAAFGFELSFPKDNPRGVGYEPWHWRYTEKK